MLNIELNKVKQMTKAIGYIRVSTEGQATEGVSLDAQTAKIRAYERDFISVRVDIVLP